MSADGDHEDDREDRPRLRDDDEGAPPKRRARPPFRREIRTGLVEQCFSPRPWKGLFHVGQQQRGGQAPTGAVGYVITGIKTIRDVSIGDTLTRANAPAEEPLAGYQPAKPVVFSSIYPMSTDE